jgi:hypothetical protein
MYFEVEPEVAGHLGKSSVVDRSIYPPTVSKLEYQLDDWLGGDLLTSFPVYIVTERLALALEGVKPTGFSLDLVAITTSEQFEEIHRDLHLPPALPEFRWLKVYGMAGKDDFGLIGDYRLIVSERALGLLQRHNIQHATIREFTESG